MQNICSVSDATATRKLCWLNLSYWLPDIKVAQFSCQLIFDKIFPKNATFKLSLMSNDEQKNFTHFYILHIKNLWFLLELEMALVTTIEVRFVLVWHEFLKGLLSKSPDWLLIQIPQEKKCKSFPDFWVTRSSWVGGCA